MMIIPIIIGILVPLLFLSIVAGIIYLIIQKKNVSEGDKNAKHIHLADIVANFFRLSLLITNVISVITIIFSIIDKLVVDNLKTNNYYELSSSREAIHSAISLVVITFPASLALAYYMRKKHEKDIAAEDTVEKFTIGATIITTGITILGSVFSVIYQYLEGDLSSRFLYKVLSVILIAVVVFVYYKSIYNKDFPIQKKYQNIFGIVSSIIIIFLCVFGIQTTGTPNQIRKEKFDERRLSDLSQIQSQILSYWQNHKVLPLNLSDVSDPISQTSVPTDPKDNTSYKYEIIKQSEIVDKKVTEAKFKICSNFESEKITKERYEGVNPVTVNSEIMLKSSLDSYYPGNNSPFWDHGIGEKCFERTIDPKIHLPDEAVPVIYKQ